jgi:hypothetical protein
MSAPREHYSMRYTMPEHRIAHLAQNLFPKMQPIFKDSTNRLLGPFSGGSLDGKRYRCRLSDCISHELLKEIR